MPLQFNEPAADSPKERPSQPAADKKKSSSSDKKSTHHRVFTESTAHFAKVTIKVISATNLPGKKSISPFARVYLGSESFSTAVKKKTLNPEWNEEFSADLDRDELIQIKIWDNSKLERNMDNYKKIEPLVKKKVSMKELVVDGSCENKPIDFNLPNGGSVKAQITVQITNPQAGEVHIKEFHYPTWVNDKYNINYVPPDFDAVKIGISTLGRYATRWILNQRAVMNSLQEKNEEKEEDEEEDEQHSSHIPEGLEFQLIDISCSSDLRVLSLVITYQWVAKVEEIKDDGPPSILQVKHFTFPSSVAKKKAFESKSTAADSYMKLFNTCCKETHDSLIEAQNWILQNRNNFSSVYKLIPITTGVSHTTMLWYYR